MKTSKAAMRAEDRIRKVYPNWPMRRINVGGLSNIIEEETHLGELVPIIEWVATTFPCIRSRFHSNKEDCGKCEPCKARTILPHIQRKD